MTDGSVLSREPASNAVGWRVDARPRTYRATRAPRFGSKAQTLASLVCYVRSARVLEQATFRASAWRTNPERILEGLRALPWWQEPLAVRSSANDEDIGGGRHAGEFDSVLSVSGEEAFRQAVDTVIDSYSAPSPEDEVLVQPMLRNVAFAGVALTYEPSAGGPYYILNYSTDGGTDAVTSGRGGDIHTFYHRRGGPAPPAPISAVVSLCQELEALLGEGGLDIEFAVTTNGELILLQVRPLLTHKIQSTEDTRYVSDVLTRQCAALKRRMPRLAGRDTIYAVMPDWNPAEIIGLQPRRLALDLYRHLITDETWARQRCRYGYRDVAGAPLIVSVCGQPFVDVRVCFNSLTPASLDEPTAEALVNHYLDHLRNRPDLHDKVEFEIAFTDYAFDFPEASRRLVDGGLAPDQVQCLGAALRAITRTTFFGDECFQEEAARLTFLQEHHQQIVASDAPLIEQVRSLLWLSRKIGARAFAGMARIDFVGQDLLRSLVVRGALSEARREHLASTVGGISRALTADAATLEPEQFLQRYGHLRPGMYDIRSPRYDEAPEFYFDWSRRRDVPEAPPPFALEPRETAAWEALLVEAGFNVEAGDLLARITRAAAARDDGKFLYSAVVSDALRLLTRWGAELGATADDLSYCALADLFAMSDEFHSAQALGDNIRRGRERFTATQSVVLPPLIMAPHEAHSFRVPVVQPNFITRLRAVGEVRTQNVPDQLEGAIVAIPNADPGFDWIFSRGVAGFVTAYGGVNSHMALRAHALGVPAVIGAGDAAFAAWSQAGRLEIDCAAQCVRIL